MTIGLTPTELTIVLIGLAVLATWLAGALAAIALVLHRDQRSR